MQIIFFFLTQWHLVLSFFHNNLIFVSIFRINFRDKRLKESSAARDKSPVTDVCREWIKVLERDRNSTVTEGVHRIFAV